MQIRSAALTDIGRIRRKNEDRYVRDDALMLYGVADGIGGLPGGAEAAELAITTLRDAIAAAPESSLSGLVAITHRINNAVCELSRKISPLGMGTTLTYALIRENQLRLAHVGDSRCYCLRSGKLTALTTDHSVENEVRRRRAAGEFVVLDESQRKSLTRCIGQHFDPEVDILQETILPGDRYLFCTDGIDKAIKEPELESILGDGAEPQHILSALIALANDRGGSDNATGVLVFVK